MELEQSFYTRVVASTRERLIAATNEQFRRQGYNGTSLKQVTEAAEATVGSLYHFFPGGKVELTETVLRETGAAYGQLFDLVAEECDGPGEAVQAFFNGAADTLEETDFIDPCPIGTVAREVASTEPRLRQAAADVFAGWIEGFAVHLRSEGIPPAASAELATTIVGSIEGGFVLCRTSRDATLLRVSGAHLRRLTEDAVDAASLAARS